MKRLVSIFILFTLSALLLGSTKTYASELTKSEAESYVLIDAATNEVILGKNENEVVVPASTTKVMTAILVLENTKLTDKVTVGAKPPHAEGTSIGLKQGDIYSVEALMHGLLLESANDCAETLAEFVGGSKEAFVKMMNEKAKALGLKKTTFVNPSGLWEDDNVTTNKTTAYELSLIMKEALKYPDYIRISKERSYKFPPVPKETFEKWVNNKDCLILKNNSHYYANTIAGKNGYTLKSKHTFTAAAEKDGRTLILSIFKAPSKEDYFPFAKSLFEYGFNKTSLIKLYSKDEEVSNYKCEDSISVPLLSSEDVFYVVNNKDYSKDDLANTSSLKKLLNPSINYGNIDLDKRSFQKGDALVSSTLNVKGKKYIDLELCSGIDKTHQSTLANISKKVFSFKTIAIIGVVIILIALIFFKRYKVYKKKRELLDKFPLEKYIDSKE